MKKTIFIYLLSSLILQNAYSQQKTKIVRKYMNPYFSHEYKNGEKFGTIFSRTIAVTGNDFQTYVFRISGTSSYTVIGNKDNQPDFEAVYQYDGRPEDRNKFSIRDFGKTFVDNNGKQSTDTDGSGLLFNSLLWGIPPEKSKKGDFWEISIDQPWELGGVGRQRVEVIDADPVTHTIRLKREGYGEGAFADDQPEMEILSNGQRLRVKIISGKSHWVGYTTFKEGIVISDELLVTRPLTLTHDDQKFNATQRQYILLNQRAE